MQRPATSCLALMLAQTALSRERYAGSASAQDSFGTVFARPTRIQDTAVSCRSISCKLPGCAEASAPTAVAVGDAPAPRLVEAVATVGEQHPGLRATWEAYVQSSPHPCYLRCRPFLRLASEVLRQRLDV